MKGFVTRSHGELVVMPKLEEPLFSGGVSWVSFLSSHEHASGVGTPCLLGSWPWRLDSNVVFPSSASPLSQPPLPCPCLPLRFTSVSLCTEGSIMADEISIAAINKLKVGAQGSDGTAPGIPPRFLCPLCVMPSRAGGRMLGIGGHRKRKVSSPTQGYIPVAGGGAPRGVHQAQPPHQRSQGEPACVKDEAADLCRRGFT
jgi:hypothetical protein